MVSAIQTRAIKCILQVSYVLPYEAIGFSIHAHRDHYLEPEGIPYIYHVWQVVKTVIRCCEGQFDIKFAYTVSSLHDVIEDCGPSVAASLKHYFQDDVYKAVSALSKDRSLKKADQIPDSLDRIKKLPPEVAIVKMADRIQNLSNPQLAWSAAKKRAYLSASIMILNSLSFASRSMSYLLEESIINYKNRNCLT